MDKKVIAKNKKDINSVKESKLIPNQYDKTRSLALFGVVGLVITYILASRALDTGSYWEYLFTLVFFIVSIRLFIRSIKRSNPK